MEGKDGARTQIKDDNEDDDDNEIEGNDGNTRKDMDIAEIFQLVQEGLTTQLSKEKPNVDNDNPTATTNAAKPEWVDDIYFTNTAPPHDGTIPSHTAVTATDTDPFAPPPTL